MQEIFAAISQYADAYRALEVLQRRDNSVLPLGDQKTGVIAEFYARLYAASEETGAAIEYGSPSQYAWDLLIRRNDTPPRKIQVKAVSEHSRTSRISPIHPGWDELWLMRLDTHLRPTGFWVLTADSVSWSTRKIEHRTMPKRGRPGSGSTEFRHAVDRLDALQSAIELPEALAAPAAFPPNSPRKSRST